MTRFEDYQNKYSSLRFERSEGILQVMLHTNGGPLVWGEAPHRELGLAFADIGNDPDNRVIILTGTGDTWCDASDGTGWDMDNAALWWGRIYAEGRRLYNNFLDIDAPVIAAVNGPATRHAALPVLCDIVLASETAKFSDRGHFSSGTVPGDANQVVWQTVLGYNRGRYFVMTGQAMTAAEFHALGVVNELLAPDKLLPRAWELARQFNKQSALTLRYTRRVLNQDIRARMRAHLDSGLPLEGLAMVEKMASEKAGGAK